MVISRISGGLGNQMFQYAMGRRLSIKRGAEYKLDLSVFNTGTDERPGGLEQFVRPLGLYQLSINTSKATDAEIARLKDPHGTSSARDRIIRRIRILKPNFLLPASFIRERHYQFDPAMLDLPDNVHLNGFWQSEKYFADVAEQIRADFAPKDSAILPYARKFVDELKALGGPVVSLHVRRGDLAHAQEINQPNLLHTVPLSMQYTVDAIARMGTECRFLVFSDSAADIAWCKANIRAERLHFSEGHTDVQDMAIMSMCDHNIIANSTFSWWAAWLNRTPGRRVISPSHWGVPGQPSSMPVDDLVPRDWEMI